MSQSTGPLSRSTASTFANRFRRSAVPDRAMFKGHHHAELNDIPGSRRLQRRALAPRHADGQGPGSTHMGCFCPAGGTAKWLYRGLGMPDSIRT